MLGSYRFGLKNIIDAVRFCYLHVCCGPSLPLCYYLSRTSIHNFNYSNIKQDINALLRNHLAKNRINNARTMSHVISTSSHPVLQMKLPIQQPKHHQSTMNSLFQSSLSTLEQKLSTLLNSLTTSPTAAGAPAAAIALLEADDTITYAITTLRQHQENYARILQLRAEAEKLEQRVKGVVQDIEAYDKEIRTACGDDGESNTDSDTDADSDIEGRSPGSGENVRKTIKEVDYKLLLDFARRISKYNHEAVADLAGAGAGESGPGTESSKRLQKQAQQDTIMTGTTDHVVTPGAAGTEPVSSVTRDATKWLDESADQTRQVYMLPYPMEERIRMGLMGQIQLAAAEGRFEPDKEVERLIREAEGLGIADEHVAAPAPALQPSIESDTIRRADEAAAAAVHVGSTVTSGHVGGGGAAPAPKPSVTLDLDLYDPENDDI